MRAGRAALARKRSRRVRFSGSTWRNRATPADARRVPRAKAEWSTSASVSRPTCGVRRPDLEVAARAGAGHSALVKGAYNEPASVAFPKKRDVDAAYFQLTQRIARRNRAAARQGVFGTHDLDMIGRIRQGRRWRSGSTRRLRVPHALWDSHPEQRALASHAAQVRVLISSAAPGSPGISGACRTPGEHMVRAAKRRID